MLRVLGGMIPAESYLNKYLFARHLQTLFARNRIDCVLDVGAYNGLFRNFLRYEVGFKGWIFSFEPVRRNISILRRRASRDPLWKIFDFALGNEDREKELNVMKADHFSSFLRPDHRIVPDFEHQNQIDHQETVSIRRLDSVAERLRETSHSHGLYLKMDTQGYDFEVLRGGEETLKSVIALQSEASVLRLYEGMTSYPVIIEYLRERGFEISAMFPVSRDSRLRLVEFDLVMVNRELCSANLN